MELRITFAHSGRIVGESTALHDYATVDADLANSVFERLRSIPTTLSNELAARVEEAVARADHAVAAAAVLEQGPMVLQLGGATARISAAARSIEAASLAPEDRRGLLMLRLAIGECLHDYGSLVAGDVRLLKSEFWSALNEAEREGVLLADGCTAASAGMPEQAFAIWRSVLELDPLSAKGRAWAYRNLSSLLKDSDPQAAELSQLAADAFLQAGSPFEAARAALRRASCILPTQPPEALAQIDQAIAWFAPDDAHSRELRAGLLHAKANALLRLGQSADAEVTAAEAAELRRGLHGAEDARAASVYLAAHAAEHAGRTEKAIEYKAEADSLATSSTNAGWKLEREIASLLSGYDEETATRLDDEARRQGNDRARAFVRVIRALQKSGSHPERLGHLEEALAILRGLGARARDLDLVHHAIAQELVAAGSPERALPHYMEVLADDPLNHQARHNAAAIMWNLGRWEEAARFYANQLKTFGPLPGLLYGYGRSLLESGDPGRAFDPLNRARTHPSASADIREEAERYVNTISSLVDRPSPSVVAARSSRAMTRDELEAALSAFCAFMRADKRMALWQSDGARAHKWTPSPEGVAKDLLHTFVKGHFRSRVEAFEEIHAGAGRVDLYLRGEGGLAVILELKMLGGGVYTTTYAFKGAEQITHYMTSKGVGLGYLVIFDARARDFGTGIDATTVVDGAVVRVLFVDVRPDVRAPR